MGNKRIPGGESDDGEENFRQKSASYRQEALFFMAVSG